MESRTLDQQRIEQGFKSQAHLDAFYAAYDHKTTCKDCGFRGEYAALDDGMQPVMTQCAVGRELDRVSFSF